MKDCPKCNINLANNTCPNCKLQVVGSRAPKKHPPSEPGEQRRARRRKLKGL